MASESKRGDAGHHDGAGGGGGSTGAASGGADIAAPARPTAEERLVIASTALDSQLAEIEDLWASQKMQAFGTNRDAVLRRMQDIRRLQARMFDDQLSFEGQHAGGAKMTPPASDDLKFCEHLRDVFEEMNKEDTALQSQMDEIMMLVKGVTDADASAAGAAPSRLGAGR